MFLMAGCQTVDQNLDEESAISIPGELITPLDKSPSGDLLLGFSSVIPPDGDLEKAYRQASSLADFTSLWVGSSEVGAWNLADVLGGEWGDTFLGDFIRGNDLVPIINLSFLDKDPSSGKLILMQPEPGVYASLSDPKFREDYKKGALDVLRITKPRYFSLGNEVNRWYEEYGADPGDPNGFQHFVSLYEEIYQEIKLISPETLVFCIFAREIVPENRIADLTPLSLFDPDMMDIVVLTTYPFAVEDINLVSDIPDTYYQDVLDAIGMSGKSLGFSEIGWSSLEYFGGEAAQVQFLEDITGRLTIERGIDLDLVAWWSLYDLENDPHQSGLISRDFREKPVFQAWLELVDSNNK
jgi:hypothetical protein